MITLIGKSLAEKGLKFMFYGASSECEDCRYKATCIESLEEGRIYRIRDLKEVEHPCPIHMGDKVQVVEVDHALIKTAIDSKKAFEGSRLLFKPPECDEKCSLKKLCIPDGLYRDDKCTIVKKLGKPSEKCPVGLNLTRVLVKY
jgi:uncharacterized protein (UPF0179 family)